MKVANSLKDLNMAEEDAVVVFKQEGRLEIYLPFEGEEILPSPDWSAICTSILFTDDSAEVEALRNELNTLAHKFLIKVMGKHEDHNTKPGE